MARKRKTRDEIQQELYAADQAVWEKFRPQLAAVKTWEEAKKLHASAVPVDAPGRRYYSNFGFFLHTYGVPSEASYEELVLYAQFIQKLDDAGSLKPGVCEKVLAELQKAIEAKRPS